MGVGCGGFLFFVKCGLFFFGYDVAGSRGTVEFAGF